MSKLFYPAVFHPEEVGYSVSVPDIDGCFSQGDTLEEATEMIVEAIGMCLEDFGSKLPVPSSLESIQYDKEDFIVLVAFDWIAYQRKYNTKAVKKTLTVPEWLNVIAEERHVNFSGVLQQALKEHLNIDRA
jgi:Uncharacterized conserved protein